MRRFLIEGTALGAEARALVHLALPVIGAQLAQIAMGLVDTVMAGQLGPSSLAAIGLGCAVWMPYLLFFMGLLQAVSPQVAHHYGAENYLAAGREVRQGLWLALLLGASGCGAAHAGIPFLAYIIERKELLPTVLPYLHAMAWGLPALPLITVLRCYTEAVSRTAPVLWMSLFGLVLNITGNWLLMFGHYGFPRLGAVGCGWASAGTAWIMLLALVGYLAWHPFYRRFKTFTRHEGPRWREILVLCRLGGPMGVSLALEGGLCLMIALAMDRMGETALAANQIALNVTGVTFMIPLGISVAITVRVGQALGRGDPRAARRAGYVGMGLAMLAMAGCGTGICLSAEGLARSYTGDTLVIAAAVPLLYRAALFQLADGLQIAAQGALRGMKETAVPAVIIIFSYWVLAIPVGYALAFWNGEQAPGVWNGLVLGIVTAAALLTARFALSIQQRLSAGATRTVGDAGDFREAAGPEAGPPRNPPAKSPGA